MGKLFDRTSGCAMHSPARYACNTKPNKKGKKKEKEQCQQGGANYMRKGARKLHCAINVDEEN
jgi:hypothetical protein